MDNITLEKLKYNELKEIVKGFCVSGLGRELIDKLEPSSNIKVVKRRLEDTSEGRRLLDASYNIPLEGIFNINSIIDKVEKGGVPEGSELLSISDFLRGCRKVKLFFQGKEGYARNLSSYSENISELLAIEDEINYSITGNRVDSRASKELKKIRKNIDICEGKIKEKLEKFLKSPSYKEGIQEFFISQRNGRYTIPIKASYKNKFPGTIIEVSSKGSTVFIEPEVLSKYTIELISLQGEESIEEYRILAVLTEMIYSYLREIKLNVEIIGELDMVNGKAKYSKSIGGISPLINERGYTKVINGYYPFIEKGVPLYFEIGDTYRSLIITGPNAGGKTVVLKTLGLLTLMVEAGFHIKADEGSEISIFEKIYVDIGDEQSVENALSTFSSHVKNLAYIMNNTNKSTLLLFDEIGSGTEPNEGAALAIAILHNLYLKGAITVATTHYGEIKDYSQKHKDFQNAAMEFKKDTLEPLYKLSIGESGASNALYISKKMGINPKVLEEAKEYINTKKYCYDLIDERKVRKTTEVQERINYIILNKGDKVRTLDYDKDGIVYEEIDNLNNLTIFIEGRFEKINYKRLKLEIRREELYPEGYDLDEIFISFKERKLEKDIKRGSKKALKRIYKEKI